MKTTIGRLRIAIAMVVTIFVVGTIGYVILGLALLDAMYMTITTITTVGYREITGPDVTVPEKIFTMILIVVGVSTVLYTFTLTIQSVVEGQLREFVGRRRMDKKISQMHDHVIVCGWGRVGKAVATDLHHSGREVVVVDVDENRLRGIALPTVAGDATEDSVLRAAGIERAFGLIAALDGDAENLFVTLSSRAARPDLFIVARARQDESVAKLQRAGADRVVNPQELGAARMASFVVQPNVAEFIDITMHERSMDFRMQELEISEHSSLAGVTLREANLRQRAGVLVLALRGDDGTFNTNPDPDTVLHARNVIIAVGTVDALEKLDEVST
ncbi:voltage-gated potassium channel [Ilumatobacter fluminis]|uniref:Voltage-gated potassium channel n=1 Tax=Ilumatobacter fluminis TaxID=467091 RepID=A0A4R7HX30_9ACTN|nr:potassium channel protein [Ilumatobacter fluminis]TDT15575.1 voltage-gated potassium channel [Ilumatobacter fluminis]